MSSVRRVRSASLMLGAHVMMASESSSAPWCANGIERLRRKAGRGDVDEEGWEVWARALREFR
jgi:hypothetical protein